MVMPFKPSYSIHYVPKKKVWFFVDRLESQSKNPIDESIRSWLPPSWEGRTWTPIIRFASLGWRPRPGWPLPAWTWAWRTRRLRRGQLRSRWESRCSTCGLPDLSLRDRCSTTLKIPLIEVCPLFNVVKLFSVGNLSCKPTLTRPNQPKNSLAYLVTRTYLMFGIFDVVILYYTFLLPLELPK